MHIEQLIVFLTLGLLLALFIYGRWRYDVVALLALLFLTFLGIVPGDRAFSGFGHPAVITVAAVLIISRALANSGLVDSATRLLPLAGRNTSTQLTLLVVLVTLFSAFMNNIGALALFLPVAIRVARRNSKSPSLFLMPMAFGSLLGGMITQIGTPPNIIISLYRADTAAGAPFSLFDFAPVGAGAALAGVVFIIFLGCKLIPHREVRLTAVEMFDIDHYLTEVHVPPGAKYAGKTLLELGRATPGDVVVAGHIRKKGKMSFLSPSSVFEAGDKIIIKANAEDLQEFLDTTGLVLEATHKTRAEDLGSGEIGIMEAVVGTNSVLERQTARSLNLRSVYGVNLLGISRQGAQLNARPDRIRFRAGDVLLLQGRREALPGLIAALGCLPLVERDLQLGRNRRDLLCLAIFASALLMAATGIAPAQVAFSAAAAALLLTGFVGLGEVYDHIDWSIIVLLGAMIPVSEALQTTGGAALIGEAISRQAGSLEPWATLALLMGSTMLLSNVVNNAAAALLMAPVAVSIAGSLAVSTDPLLMAVAVGASCAFLTPIGHQSNTLVMGPGGYHFDDYWPMGLPLSLLVAAAAVPLIMLVWPF